MGFVLTFTGTMPQKTTNGREFHTNGSDLFKRGPGIEHLPSNDEPKSLRSGSRARAAPVGFQWLPDWDLEEISRRADGGAGKAMAYK
jgi:hypothetical protein